MGELFAISLADSSAIGFMEVEHATGVRKAMEIMDGVQLWWLREPEVDLCKEWAQMENMLFPSPLWDAYR